MRHSITATGSAWTTRSLRAALALSALAAGCTVAGQTDEELVAVEPPEACVAPELRLAATDGGVVAVEDLCAGDRASARLVLAPGDANHSVGDVALSPDGRFVAVTAWRMDATGRLDNQVWLYGPIVSLEGDAMHAARVSQVAPMARVVGVSLEGEARLRQSESLIGIPIDGAPVRTLFEVPDDTDRRDIRTWANNVDYFTRAVRDPDVPGLIERVELISFDTGEVVESWRARDIVATLGEAQGERLHVAPLGVTKAGRALLFWSAIEGDTGEGGRVWAHGKLIEPVEPDTFDDAGSLSPAGNWWVVDLLDVAPTLMQTSTGRAVMVSQWPALFESINEPANDPQPDLYAPCLASHQVADCGRWLDTHKLVWSPGERRVLASFYGGEGQVVGIQLRDLEANAIVLERVFAAEPGGSLAWDAVVFDAP